MGFSQPQPSVEQSSFNISYERTSNNKYGVPLPVFYGLHKSATFWMSDLFDDRTETVTENVQTGKNSSRRVVTAVNYFASWIAGVGYVHNMQLLEIQQSDDTKWEDESGGIVADTTVESWTLDIGENVPIVIYTGNQTAPDSVAFANNPTHPAYKRIAYYRLEQILYGQTPVPPNYEFIFRSIIKRFVLDPENESGDAEQDRDEFHLINEGCLIPEIIYDLITNEYYGLSRSPEQIDEASFISCCQTLIDEQIGYAFKMRSRRSLDASIKQMMNLVDAEWIDVGDKIGMRLNRRTDEIISIPESAFLASPKISSASWYDDNVINEVRIPYAPIESALEPTVAKATDQSSIDRIGMKSKSYTFDGLRTAESAQAIANRFVKISSVPKVPYTLRLTSQYSSLQKGDRIAPIYPKRRLDGSTIIRVQDVTTGSTKRPSVTIKGEIDHTVVTTQEGDNDAILTATPYEPQALNMRMLFLTEPQRQGFQDGFVSAVSRPTAQEDGALFYTSSDGNDFNLIANRKPFTLEIEVVEWVAFDADQVIMRFKFLREHEENSFLSNNQNGLPDWAFLCSLTDENGVNSMSPVWCSIDLNFELDIIDKGDGTFDYAVLLNTGQFDSDSLDFEADKRPSKVAFIAPLGNFYQYRTNQFNFERQAGNSRNDTAQVRTILTRSTYRGTAQSFEDSHFQTYDRVNNVQALSWGGAVASYGGLGVLFSIDEGIFSDDLEVDFVGGGVFDVSVDWGDGDSTQLNAQSSPLRLEHNYSDSDTYQVTVITTDTATGLKNTRTQSFDLG